HESVTGAGPEHAVPGLDDGADAGFAEAVLTAIGANDAVRRDAREAAACRADPHRAVAVLVDGQDTRTAQPLRRAEHVDAAARPAIQPRVARADPHRALAIDQQRRHAVAREPVHAREARRPALGQVVEAAGRAHP